MTEPKKIRQLSWEILGLLGLSALLTAAVFWLLGVLSWALVEEYCFRMALTLTQEQLWGLENGILNLRLVLSAAFFGAMFLSLLGDRLAYIRRIHRGIQAMGRGEDPGVPLEGRNELTQLAEAVNYLAQAQKELREKEAALNREKEQLIRSLSHDIRTPLTAVLSYSEWLLSRETPERETLEKLRQKALQIRDLTDILLEGSRRNPGHFADAGLLLRQLGAEFEEALEEEFSLSVEIRGDGPGTFDVGELQRILDNLISNVKKYADPRWPVFLSLELGPEDFRIRQENRIRPRQEAPEGFRIGLTSIRRIAQSYGGTAETEQKEGTFQITVVLKNTG